MTDAQQILSVVQPIEVGVIFNLNLQSIPPWFFLTERGKRDLENWNVHCDLCCSVLQCVAVTNIKRDLKN